MTDESKITASELFDEAQELLAWEVYEQIANYHSIGAMTSGDGKNEVVAYLTLKTGTSWDDDILNLDVTFPISNLLREAYELFEVDGLIRKCDQDDVESGLVAIEAVIAEIRAKYGPE